MGNFRHLVLPAALLLWAACSSDPDGVEPRNGTEGRVEIVLTQSPETSPLSRADGALPPVDSFKVEIYNAKGLRLYRSSYHKTKVETINLNAGAYRLVAHHGDSLEYGFGKPYYLADKAFTVHAWKDNGGRPDQVSAVAKMANVGMRVKYGPNLLEGYSDCYVFVRHDRYAAKSVLFSREESRTGYLPGGKMHLEVYARLTADSLVRFRSEGMEFAPNDLVTFHVDTRTGRPGALSVTVLVDDAVEKIEKTFSIPASAVPAGPPRFVFDGEVSDGFTVRGLAGIASPAEGAVLGIFAGGGLSGIRMETSGFSGIPAAVDLLALSAAERTALRSAGLVWNTGANVASLDFSGLLPAVFKNGGFDPSDPAVAAFRLTATDRDGKSSTATLRAVAAPVASTVSVHAHDIWGWKIVSPTATLPGLTEIPAGTDIRLQYSSDGSSWRSVEARSIGGNQVTFQDVQGLAPGTAWSLRAVVGGDSDNAGEVLRVETEAAQQVGNAGFEEYAEQEFTTKISWWPSDYTVTWWQPYRNAEEAWWAVNSPVTLNSKVAVAYPDFKTFPTVSLTGTDACSGSVSAIVASVAIDDVASLILFGDARTGEIFLGKANDRTEEGWAKISEGHAFASRPSALGFHYKFSAHDADPFLACVEVLSSDGAVIGSGRIDDRGDDVPAWTLCTVPIRYTVTDRKASAIRISFKSSATGSKKARAVTVNTLSGRHDIHAGSVLYLDDVQLIYNE